MSTATLNGAGSAGPATGFDTLYAWLQNTDPAKLASEIPAESEHDDGGEKATEGARSGENDADVKKITNGNAVPGGTPVGNGKMDNPIEGSGLNQSTTGKNPEVERAVKTVKGEAEKMAAADLSTDAGYKAAYDALMVANAQLPILLAHCGVEMPPAVTAGQPTNKTASAPQPAAKTQPDTAAAAFGYSTKEAADQAAAAVVAGYQKLGSERGHLTAQYLKGYHETMGLLTKMAEDGSLEAAMQGGPPGAGAAAAPGGAPGGGDPAAAAAAMQGGGAPGGAPGGDPAAGGGDPSGGAGGEGGHLSMEEIVAALQEMGITPEQLQQILGQAQGGVQATPDSAAAPEEKAAALASIEGWSKAASEMTPYMRSGKYEFKPAADGSRERARRNSAKDYIKELQKFAGGN